MKNRKIKNIVLSDNAIIVFIKNPELGKVKTRLANTIGDTRALKIYGKLCEYTRQLLLNINCDRYLFYDQTIIAEDDWSNESFYKKLQTPGDLGHRMQSAFSKVLDNHKKVLIIGSDCPQITQKHIKLAFDSLDQTDVVIGPSLDGGYYLLGMKQEQFFLFEDMPWSKSSLYGKSLQKIFSRNKSVSELEYLTDIDYEEDLKLVDWL